MDAPLVRAYLDALPDVPPDERSVARVRYCLATLQSPDIRYLVATIAGPRAAEVAEVARSVLGAAGARAAVLGPTLEGSSIDGAPIDDALIGQAGTLAAAAGYQLAATGAELGELVRRDAVVVLALTAFAEASQRVALLLDEAADPADPVHAPRPDLFVSLVSGSRLDATLALAPADRPLIVAGAPRERIEALEKERDAPVLLAGRDHAAEERSGRLIFSVRDERYVDFDPVAGRTGPDLEAGIATALALGAMGIRMREEWVLAGIERLRRAAVAT